MKLKTITLAIVALLCTLPASSQLKWAFGEFDHGTGTFTGEPQILENGATLEFYSAEHTPVPGVNMIEIYGLNVINQDTTAVTGAKIRRATVNAPAGFGIGMCIDQCSQGEETPTFSLEPGAGIVNNTGIEGLHLQLMHFGVAAGWGECTFTLTINTAEGDQDSITVIIREGENPNGIADNTRAEEFKAYMDGQQLLLSGVEAGQRVSIADLSGKTIYDAQLSDNGNASIYTNLSQGIYLVSLWNGNELIVTRKVLSTNR